MHGPFPTFDSLYDHEALRALVYHAARVEAEGYGRWTRAEEVVEVARRLGVSRLGIGYCPDMAREALLTARFLERRGLAAVVAPQRAACAPVEQARLLRERGAQLLVIAGMCVGHDALFIRHAAVPVTSLVVRDWRLRHNPVAALYTRRGYLKNALYGPIPPAPEPPFAGWSDALLARAAHEVGQAALDAVPAPCRVAEVMAFARAAGVTRMGLVFCAGFREEAAHLDAILGTNGFRVASACCKTGAVPKTRLGIRAEQQVRPGTPEVMCNPLAQAELLESAHVQLVLLLGQCVGHDAATLMRLRTPAVCVVAKDRVLAHNTVAALYADEHATSGPGCAEIHHA